MGNRQLVTAVVVAMTLGSAWPAGADDPDKDKKSTHTIKQNAPQQDKAPAETSRGRNAGPAGAAQKIPGTGGAANAQNPLATPATSTPTANTLYDPNQNKPQGSTPPGTKVVTPETFKSKEDVVKELANPTPESSNSPNSKAFDRTGGDALRDFPTTVTPGFGKNPSTTRQQQSEGTQTGTIPGTSVTATVTQKGRDIVNTFAGPSGDSIAQVYSLDDKAGAPPKETTVTTSGIVDGVRAERVAKTTAAGETTTITWTDAKTGRQIQVERQFTPAAGGAKKMPNPDTDTGDGHVPKGLAGQGRPQKSPSQIEAERRRQVTQPSDDQRREAERMMMDARVALKSAMEKRTAGRIDENPVGDGAVGATGNPRQGTGSGCVQVDCAPTGPPSRTAQ